MVTSSVMHRYVRAIFSLMLFVWAPECIAQGATALDLGGGVVANGEAERYLRVLQLLGEVPQHPVGIRPWTRHEMRGLVPAKDHPWTTRFARGVAGGKQPTFTILRPSAGARWNSTRPDAASEGGVWFGRGVSVDGSAGVRFTAGILDVQLAPTLFWAQNQAFTVAPNGLIGSGALRDARYPEYIDAPQRFGTSGYGRVDGGNSRVAVETRIASVGFATAPMAWGPARDEPLVVGPNGGGFAHFFVGSGEPWPVYIGKVHWKLLAGRLEQSAWSPEDSGNRSRFASATVITFEPRGVRGLELGLVRFQHRPWYPGVATFSNAMRPFTGILSDPGRYVNTGGENGYASLFFRWAAAPAGFELFGEYGREDYAGNTRWLLQKPDDLGNLLLGFQKAWRSSSNAIRVLRAEVVNAELSSNERGQRGFGAPIPPYLHGGTVRQGHTVNGLFLGSATAYGGAGWRVATDRYTPQGRRSVVVERRLLKDWLPVPATAEGRAPEVQYNARYEMLRFGRKGREVEAAAGLGYTLNRNTVPHDDALNVQASIRWRGW
jgi:hypothetical protein